MIKFLSFLKLTKDIRTVSDYKILNARFVTIKNKLTFFLPKTPKKLSKVYKQKIDLLQSQANRVYKKWAKFEIDFKKIKRKGFKNKSHEKSIYYKRNMLKIEYESILNTFSLLLISLKSYI